MRVVLRAENGNTRNAMTSTRIRWRLWREPASFTKRMAHTTDRGDYTASFRPDHEGPNHDGFVFTMTPKQLDSEHRSFYAEEEWGFTPTIRNRRIWIRRK